MNFFQNIYKFLRNFFERLSFRTKPKSEFFNDDDSGHTEYEYEFIPLNENKMER